MEELVCPLDFRYGRDVMKRVLSHENRLRNSLRVEAALARAQADIGIIPKAAAVEITRKATLDHVKVGRVNAIEKEIRHDIMAIVRALSEQCQKGAGDYVHLGATSYDIVDTAMALELREALGIIRTDLFELLAVLADLSHRYRDQVMAGRTHGQYGLPITLGLKFSVWTQEVMRHIERIDEGTARMTVGKMAGAVGTSAGFGHYAQEIRTIMSNDLDIGFEEATTQIVQRDRYIELVSLMANIATSMEKFATEIRNLQRSDIGEVCEGFDAEKQVGSSTMAHKKNPITCENICGLARTLRGFMVPTWENAIQWHERDLANSSSERFVIPHVLILADDILVKMTDVLKSVVVHPDAMAYNLGRSKGLIMAESVMLALVDREVMGRQEAHEFMRRASMDAQEKGLDLFTVLRGKRELVNHMTEREIKALLDPKNYVGDSKRVVDLTVKNAKKMLKKA